MSRPAPSYSDAASEPLALPELSDVSAVPQPSASEAVSVPLTLPSQGTVGPSQRLGSQVTQRTTPRRSRGRRNSFGRPGSFGGQAPSFVPSPFPTVRGDLGGRTPRVVRGRSSSLQDIEDGDSHFTEDVDEGGKIWGTNISVSNVVSRFRRFIKIFPSQQKDPNVPHEPKYLKLLVQAIHDQDLVFNIDMHDVWLEDSTLYDFIVNHPKDVISLLDDALAEIALQELDADEDEVQMQVRPFNLTDTRAIRELDPEDIDKLISVSGMVTRTSNIIPELRWATYECEACLHEQLVQSDRGQIEEPMVCNNCGAKMMMRLIHNRSWFNNKQLIKLQESPNEIPEGETPQSLSLFAFDELVDIAKPGDRVTVTGVFKAAPIRVANNRRELRAIYKTHIDIVHVKKEEVGRLFSLFGADAGSSQPPLLVDPPASPHSEDGSQAGGEAMQVDGTLADNWGPLSAPDELPFQVGNMLREQVVAKEAAFQAMAADPDIYDKLVASLAPSIFQMEDVKKGVLSQLFGGLCKTFSGGRTRGEIHVLLVGDPGVSKSQLLTYVNKIAPRGIYTSGRGSSAVGLTAYVTRDPETREMVLESGALVLSDMGCCCIDEFDKMSDSARSTLHEVMEQQTVSVAKAGIIATLNARTSILASANPINSRYNPRLSVVENIMLPPTLLSRFDLIYLLLDKANEAADRRLARHLVALHFAGATSRQQPPYSKELLREYVAYARAKCQPVISEEATQKLIDGYMDMRRMGGRNVITATARQLESLIRLSEAQARMRLAPTVTAADVDEAIRLVKVATLQTATDQTTGVLDLEALNTGVTMGQRQARQQIAEEIRKIMAGVNGPITVLQLLTKLQEQSSVAVAEKDVKAALTLISDQVNWNQETGRVALLRA